MSDGYYGAVYEYTCGEHVIFLDIMDDAITEQEFFDKIKFALGWK